MELKEFVKESLYSSDYSYGLGYDDLVSCVLEDFVDEYEREPDALELEVIRGEVSKVFSEGKEKLKEFIRSEVDLGIILDGVIDELLESDDSLNVPMFISMRSLNLGEKKEIYRMLIEE